MIGLAAFGSSIGTAAEEQLRTGDVELRFADRAELPVEDRSATVDEHVEGMKVPVAHHVSAWRGPMLVEPTVEVVASGVVDGLEARRDV